MTVGEIDAPPQRPRVAWSLVAATGALSTILGVLALVTAPGATTVDGTSYDTTFVTEWLWWLAYALVPVAAVLLWRAAASYLTYVAVGAALVVPHVVVAAVVFARYQWSGWGSGLEIFSFIHPAGLFGLTLLALTAVGAVDATRRQLAAARRLSR